MHKHSIISATCSNHRKQFGFTIIELMIGVAIGLFILGGVITIYAQTVASGTDVARSTRLEEEMSSVMALVSEDIRRASFNADAFDNSGGAWANPFATVTVANFAGGAGANDCILYSHDLNENQLQDADERFGVRWNGSVVEIADNSTACNNGDWNPVITDNVTVTNLDFDLNSTCINATDPAVACGAAAAGDQLVTVRDVTITLAAQLASDAFVTRTLTETIRIRNDVVTQAP